MAVPARRLGWKKFAAFDSTRIRAVAFLPILVFLSGAALFAWAGTFTRFWADDYCYSAYVQSYGLPAGIYYWFLQSGNRLSTLVMVAISDAFGLAGLRAVPAALLASWMAAAYLFLRSLSRRAGWQVSSVWWLAGSAACAFFVALLAPDRLQTIYWRMGALHYNAPLPLLLLHFAIVVRCFGRCGWWFPLVSGVLAFFAAGLSETFAALQAGLFGLCLLVGLFVGRSVSGWKNRLRNAGSFLPGLTGTLLMMGIMLLSPSNAWRQAALPPPDNILLVIPYAMRFTMDFLFFSLRGQFVPYTVFVLFMAAVAVVSGLAGQLRSSNRALLLSVPGCIVITVFLTACSFAPSAFAGLAYPAGRALMPGFAVMLAGLSVLSVLIASLALRAVRGRWVVPLALVVMLLCSLYPLRVAGIPRADARRFAAWAERWDARDAQIRGSVAAGVRDVTVQEIEVVQTLEDLRPDPGHWVNTCAAIYYTANSITAHP